MAVPLIFVHRQNNYYLGYTLAQARFTNPDSPVVLIGDHTNRYQGVDHYLLAEYDQGATEFARVYQHLSCNSESYELFCFQRWFILRDFMASHQLGELVSLDSDVLLYAPVSLGRWQKYDFAFPETIPCLTWVRSYAALENFCQFLLSLYQDPERFAQMEEDFRAQVRDPRYYTLSSISDMYAFSTYGQVYPERVGDCSEIVEGCVLDANINDPHTDLHRRRFEEEGERRLVVWVEGQPYGRLADSGELVRFNSLHFQGFAKAFIREYFTAGEPLLLDMVAPYQPKTPQGTTGGESRGLDSPDSQAAQIDLGFRLVAQGALEQAIVQSHPHLPHWPELCQQEFYEGLTYRYIVRGNRSKAAEYAAAANSLRLLTVRPTWPEIHYQAALVFHRLGQLSQALEHYQRALELSPEPWPEVLCCLDQASIQHSQLQEYLACLGSVNWVVFPVWEASEGEVYACLRRLLGAVFHQKSLVTLWINAQIRGTAIDIWPLVEEVAWDLMSELPADSTLPEVYPFAPQSFPVWTALASHFQGRIILGPEDLTTLPPEIASLPGLHLQDLEVPRREAGALGLTLAWPAAREPLVQQESAPPGAG